MPSKHKHSPIPFRPPEGDQVRLLARARRDGLAVNRILADALAAYLDADESPTITRQAAGAEPVWCSCWADNAQDVVWAVCPTGVCDTASIPNRQETTDG